jgi:hypothetical protein
VLFVAGTCETIYRERKIASAKLLDFRFLYHSANRDSARRGRDDKARYQSLLHPGHYAVAQRVPSDRADDAAAIADERCDLRFSERSWHERW